MKEENLIKNIRPAMQENLIKEFDRLLYPSLDYLKENFESYQRVSFEGISVKKMPFQLDLESCVDLILDSREDISGTLLDYKIGDGFYWGSNEIRYPFASKIPIIPEWGTEQFLKYREWRDDMEYNCQDEFWTEKGQQQSCDVLFSTNIFDDKVFKEDKLSYYQNSSKFFYSKESWLGFVVSLVEMFFPEYKYNKEFSSKKIRRYLIEIKKDVWFGFEYDESEIVAELRRGVPMLPDFFNIILIDPTFNKSEPVLNYYYKKHDSIISLGILGNPFFYHPCYPLLGYSAVDSFRSEGEGKPYIKKIIRLNDNEYQIVQPKEYEYSMKKHALFYMDILASTSSIFLEYLKEVVKNVM